MTLIENTHKYYIILFIIKHNDKHYHLLILIYSYLLYSYTLYSYLLLYRLRNGNLFFLFPRRRLWYISLFKIALKFIYLSCNTL